MRLSLTIGPKSLGVALVLVVVVMAAMAGGAEYYTAQPEFCGTTCHVMNRAHTTWKESKHKDVACVDCHYAPGEKFTLHAKFKGLSQLFSYLAEPGAPVRKRAVVSDLSCTAAGCHQGDEFNNKKFNFTDKVGYVHKTHTDKTIEGQKLHCNTCHVHDSADKHFEVREESCYLCHFKGEKFNRGRGACEICHAIPTDSLQSQLDEDSKDKEPITHQTLEEKHVPCGSCHRELVVGAGTIKQEACNGCHDDGAELEKFDDKKLMHERHIATQQADCFDCHRPIAHQEGEFLEPVRGDCAACHPDHHKFQMLLLAGAERDDVSETPALMQRVKTNCLGCHQAVKHARGQVALTGSPKACVACHTQEHEQMVADWKHDVERDLKDAKELEAEALAAIAAAKGVMTEAQLDEATGLLSAGQENLRIVEYGNGVHNKKYSILLLDAAFVRFEELLDLLPRAAEPEQGAP